MNQDETIKALQKELNNIEGQNKRLPEEVVDLRVGQQVVDDLKVCMKTLEKEVAGSKAMEELALAHL